MVVVAVVVGDLCTVVLVVALNFEPRKGPIGKFTPW